MKSECEGVCSQVGTVLQPHRESANCLHLAATPHVGVYGGITLGDPFPKTLFRCHFLFGGDVSIFVITAAGERL